MSDSVLVWEVIDGQGLIKMQTLSEPQVNGYIKEAGIGDKSLSVRSRVFIWKGACPLPQQ